MNTFLLLALFLNFIFAAKKNYGLGRDFYYNCNSSLLSNYLSTESLESYVQITPEMQEYCPTLKTSCCSVENMKELYDLFQ